MTVYTLFNQASPGVSAQADTTEYTLSMEFSLNQSGSLTGMWFYSGSGSQDLPVACGIFRMTSAGAGSLVTSNNSPTWGGALAASGWVRQSFSGVTLNPGNVYKASVAGASGGDWYSVTPNYWTSGAGANGLTSGPIVAPKASLADVGQDAFFPSSQVLSYPSNYSGNGPNYWIDVEITVSSGVVITVPLRASMIQSNALEGAVSQANQLEGVIAQTNQLGGQIWQ